MPVNLQAQQPTAPGVLEASDTTFAAICNRMNAYFASPEWQANGDGGGEGGLENQFRRWAHFWRIRLDDNGGFEGTNKTMANFINSGFQLCDSKEDDDIDWRELGPFNSDGALEGDPNCSQPQSSDFIGQNQGWINAISVDPTDEKKILAGGRNGGIWKTEDGGANWHNTTDDEGYSIVGASDIVRHPQQPNTIYAATHGGLGAWYFGHDFGLGIIKSIDGGETWEATDYSPIYGFHGRVFRMVIDPNSTLNNTSLYLSTPHEPIPGVNVHDNGAIVRYTEDAQGNGSTTYLTLPLGLDEVQYYHLEIESDGTVWFTDDNIAGTTRIGKIPPQSSTAESVDIPNPDPSSLTNPSVEFIDINDDDDIVLYITYDKISSPGSEKYFCRSVDSGNSWTFSQPISVNLRVRSEQGYMELAPHDSNVIYFENGGRCVKMTSDFGDHFSFTDNRENHVDVRTIVPYETNNSYKMFLGTDGGISRLEPDANGDGMWQDITGQGMANTNFYGLGLTEERSDFIFLGAQDGSINFYNDGEWFETLPGGDNGDCIINPNPANGLTLIFQQVQNDLRRTTLNGAETNTNYGSYTDPPGDDGAWIYPLYLNPGNPDELFAATDRLCMHPNAWGSGSWQTLSPQYEPIDNGIGVLLSSVVTSEADDNFIYYTLIRNTGSVVYKYDRSTSMNIDITSNLRQDFVPYAPATGIAVDPQNPNHIWVAFGRFSAGNKVFKSTDGGNSWTNISGCLPNIPVTQIRYQKGSNDRLYIGTDFGVFYKDADMVDWVYYGNGGPRCMVADMDINYCGNKLVVATQGRGLWEVDLLPITGEKIASANGDILWDSDRDLLTDIYVTTGTTLTIQNCTVNIAGGKRIIIDAGATVIVDNATLTNGCGAMWQGIEVWGDASKNQYFDHQGKLIVRNNSIIEYARNAVKLGKTGDDSMQETGGIVLAENSTFRNNIRAIELLKYRNSNIANSSITIGNFSSFTNCIFETIEDLPGGALPNSFITMWAVDNISIKGCDFQNTNPSAASLDALGQGIYTIDASFNVKGCIGNCPIEDPCCSLDPCNFINLKFGIHATKESSIRSYSVDHSYFENCWWSIANNGVDFAKITRNDFSLGYLPVSGDLAAIGIFNYQGTQFTIEENTFDQNTAANRSITGTVTWDIGEDNNQIYKNTFNNMTTANMAIGDNNSTQLDCKNLFPGLAYFCNQQNNSEKQDITSFNGTGIRHYQFPVLQDGNSTQFLTAGNTFTNSGLPESDFANSSGMDVWYIFGAVINEEPIEYTVGKVNPQSFSNFSNASLNVCPSNFGTSKEVIELSFVTNENALQNSKNEREIIVGCNKINQLLEDIFNAPTNDPIIKGKLSALGPFVPVQVIKEILAGGKLTGNDLYDILLANPDALGQSDILQIVEDNQLLNTNQIANLINNIGTWTDRTSLEAKITHFGAEKDRAAKQLIHLLRETPDDEVSPNWYMETLDQLNTFEGLPSNYAKIDYVFDKGNRQDATNLLNDITSSFDLNTERLAEFTDLQQIFGLINTVRSSDRTEYQLTASELLDLEGLADSGHGKARTKARNILAFFYGYTFPIEMPSAETGKEGKALSRIPASGQKQVGAEKNKVRANLINIAPNPASTKVKIIYESPSIYGNNGSIEITSTYGKTLYFGDINDQNKTFEVDVQDWPNGTYFCLYKKETGSVKVIPFIVNH